MPNVGDIVLYKHRSTKDNSKPPHRSPAIVLEVHEDGTVNLHVFYVMGGTAFRANIEQGDGEYQWNWRDAKAKEVE